MTIKFQADLLNRATLDSSLWAVKYQPHSHQGEIESKGFAIIATEEAADILRAMIISPDEVDGVVTTVTTSDIPFQAETVLLVDSKNAMIKSHKEQAREVEKQWFESGAKMDLSKIPQGFVFTSWTKMQAKFKAYREANRQDPSSADTATAKTEFAVAEKEWK